MKLPSSVTEALQDMQKVELHCHLELALRQSTLRELAAIQGHDVRTAGVFEAEFLIEKPMGKLPEVLHKFLNTRDVIDSEDWMEASVQMMDSKWARQVPNRAERLCSRMEKLSWLFKQ